MPVPAHPGRSAMDRTPPAIAAQPSGPPHPPSSTIAPAQGTNKYLELTRKIKSIEQVPQARPCPQPLTPPPLPVGECKAGPAAGPVQRAGLPAASRTKVPPRPVLPLTVPSVLMEKLHQVLQATDTDGPATTDTSAPLRAQITEQLEQIE